MKSTHHLSVRTVFGLLLLAGSVVGFSACSSHETANRQQGVTDVHQGMMDRRESRQKARDERFQASRDSWMN